MTTVWKQFPNRMLPYSIHYFPILRYFSGIFSSVNNLIRQENTVCKTDKIISESEIVSREAVDNTERKTRQTGRAGRICLNWETPAGAGRFERSVSDTSVIICSRWKPEQLKLDSINLPLFNHDKHESLIRVREAVPIYFFRFLCQFQPGFVLK